MASFNGNKHQRGKLTIVIFAVFILTAFPFYSQTTGTSNYKAEKELYQLNNKIKQQLPEAEKATPETLQKVIKQYRALAEKYPGWENTPNLYFRITELYLLQGKTEEAIAELKNLAQRYPDDEQLALKTQAVIARTYEKQGDYDKAIAQSREIAEKFADKPTVVAKTKFDTARMLEEKGEWEEAVRIFEEIQKDYAQTAQALQVPVYIAYHYRKTGETELLTQAYQKAVTDYQKIITDYPNTKVAILAKQLLAESYVGLGNSQKARELLNELVEVMPDSVKLHYNLARLYIQERKLAEAISEMEKALALVSDKQPAPPGAYLDMVKLYLTAKQPEKAEKLMLKELESNPKNVVAYNLLGDVYQTMNRFDEAKAQYEQAIKVNPKLPVSHYSLGVYYLRKNNFREAAKKFEEALELNPKYLLALMNLGTTNEQLGKNKEAEKAYRRLIELAPDNISAYNNLAWMYATQNRSGSTKL